MKYITILALGLSVMTPLLGAQEAHAIAVGWPRLCSMPPAPPPPPPAHGDLVRYYHQLCRQSYDLCEQTALCQPLEQQSDALAQCLTEYNACVARHRL